MPVSARQELFTVEKDFVLKQVETFLDGSAYKKCVETRDALQVNNYIRFKQRIFLYNDHS